MTRISTDRTTAKRARFSISVELANRVVTPWIQGVAAQYAAGAEPQAPCYSVTLDGSEEVGGTAWEKAAGRRQQRGEKTAIAPNQDKNDLFTQSSHYLGRLLPWIKAPRSSLTICSDGILSAPLLAMMTMSCGEGISWRWRRKNSLSRLLTLFRATAFPTLELTVTPSLFSPLSLALLRTTKWGVWTLLAARERLRNSERLVRRALFGNLSSSWDMTKKGPGPAPVP